MLLRMSIAAAISLALISGVSAQNMKCPVCTGPNVALQFTGNACICGTITGVAGPAGPAGPQGPQGIQGIPGAMMPASTCPATGTYDHWTGTVWDCTPTRFLTY